MGTATGTVFRLGNHIGEVGSVAFIGATTIAAVTAILRFRSAAVPPSILEILGAVLFLQAHIYSPVGVIGQLALALGWVWLYFPLERPARARAVAVAPVIGGAVQQRD